MKKLITLGVTMLAALSLAACGSSNASKDSSSKPEKATKVDSSKESSKKAESSSKAAAKQADSESIPTTADADWFFSKTKNVFYAGNETMTLTKSEVRDGLEDGTKVLVIYCDILNNAKEEMDPSNFYMVVHAKQKTDTSNVTLNPGMVKTDADGNNPLQAEDDALNNALLPGKTIHTALLFDLKNTNPVTVEFSDSDMAKTLGTKEYAVE